MKDILVKNLMTKKVVKANLEDTFKDVALSMKENNIGCLPVMDGKDIMGIITDRDIIIRGLIDNITPETEIGQYITSDIISIGSKENIEMALNIMGKFQIKRILVVDKNKLVGILCLSDIVLNESIDTSRILKEIYRNEDPTSDDAKIDDFDL